LFINIKNFIPCKISQEKIKAAKLRLLLQYFFQRFSVGYENLARRDELDPAFLAKQGEFPAQRFPAHADLAREIPFRGV
jgi:hypothetical protein